MDLHNSTSSVYFLCFPPSFLLGFLVLVSYLLLLSLLSCAPTPAPPRLLFLCSFCSSEVYWISADSWNAEDKRGALLSEKWYCTVPERVVRLCLCVCVRLRERGRGTDAEVIDGGNGKLCVLMFFLKERWRQYEPRERKWTALTPVQPRLFRFSIPVAFRQRKCQILLSWQMGDEVQMYIYSHLQAAMILVLFIKSVLWQLILLCPVRL